MALLPYLTRRLLISIPVVLIVSIGVFSMVDLFPGTQVEALTGDTKLTPQQEAVLRHQLGLDRPFFVRFVTWAGDALKGDLGQSRSQQSSVSGAIKHRLGPSLQLGIFSLLIGATLGIPAGIIAAVRKGGMIDFLATVVAVGGVAMPSFLMAIVLVLLFSVKLRWFPATGFTLITSNPLQALKFTLLPAFTVGIGLSASLMRQTRSSMLEVLNQDYVRTARAKGLYDRTVILRHALKNALLPVITILGLQIGVLFTGQVLIEQIFAIPGLGRLMIDAIAGRDVVLIQGLVLFVAVGLILVNLLTDISYGFVDRRAGVA